MAPDRLIAPVLVLALAACRPAVTSTQASVGEPKGDEPRVDEPRVDEPRPSAGPNTAECPRPALLDEPDARVDIPLAEHAFARCNVRTGPGILLDQSVYEQQVECADPPGRPVFDFAEVRLVVVALEAPSSLLGATREPGSAITRIHLVDHAYCEGVDPGDDVHVVVIPADGSEIEIDVCHEMPRCADPPPA